MPTATITAKPAGPITHLSRPNIPSTGVPPLTLTPAEYKAYLASLPPERYLDEGIELEAGSSIESLWSEPLVASTALCSMPGVIGGASRFSPKALIHSRWHDLAVVVEQDVTMTNPATAIIDVSSVDRDLPKGFVFGFYNNGWNEMLLLANVAAGATTMQVQTINHNVNIPNGSTLLTAPGYFYQHGVGSANLRNLMLVGDPANMLIDPRNNNDGDTFNCDALAISGMGTLLDNIYIYNFPGHGLRIQSPTLSDSLIGNIARTHFDFWECTMNGMISVFNALAGTTIDAPDAKFNKITGAGCREYGLKLNGPNIQGNTAHCWGCKLGAWVNLGGSINHIEGENCDYGMNVLYTPCEMGTLKVWGNKYRGIYLAPYDTTVACISAEQSDPSTTGTADPSGELRPTGLALLIGDFTDRLICGNIVCVGKGGASCMQIGIDHNHTITEMMLRGTIRGESGSSSKALHIKADMDGCELDFGVSATPANGFPHAVRMESNVVLTGNRLLFRGPAANKILWPNGAIGTFGHDPLDETNFPGPNVPSVISDNNYVQILAY